MNAERFLALMEQTLDLPAQTIRLDDRLQDLEGWDSMGALGLIATVDEQCGVVLDGGDLAECRTARDLFQRVMAVRRAA